VRTFHCVRQAATRVGVAAVLSGKRSVVVGDGDRAGNQFVGPVPLVRRFRVKGEQRHVQVHDQARLPARVSSTVRRCRWSLSRARCRVSSRNSLGARSRDGRWQQ
jgi:hypothetical protein